MKKFIALLLIAVMTMGLVACGAKTEDKPSGTVSNPGEFWGNKTENNEDNKENRKPVEKIEINIPEDYEYEQKPDFFYDDGKFEYYMPYTIVEFIMVTYEDGTTENIEEALKSGHIGLEDLDNNHIVYRKKLLTGNRNNAGDKTPSEVASNVVKIENTATPDMVFAQALEYFYEDETNKYYFSCIMSSVIIVTYEDGTTENVSEAINAGRITIDDLDKYNIKYGKEAKTEK